MGVVRLSEETSDLFDRAHILKLFSLCLRQFQATIQWNERSDSSCRCRDVHCVASQSPLLCLVWE